MHPTFIIDFDSTLVTVESLDELAAIALAGRPNCELAMAELKNVTALGMSGAMDFDSSLRHRLQLFSATRQHVEVVTRLLHDHISPSALVNRDWFREHAGRIYVVSGGFVDYIAPVVRHLGISPEHVFANRFSYDTTGTIVGYDPTCLTSRAKGKAQQVAALNLPTPVVAIGDGYTDFEVKATGAAEEFWAFTETANRPSVVARADRVLASFDDLTSATL